MAGESSRTLSPKQVLLNALAEHLTDVQGNRLEIELWPSLTSESISDLRFCGLPAPIPDDVQELLQLAKGFTFAPIGDLDFTFECWPTPYGTLHHCGVALAGNNEKFWLQDIRDDTGAWGSVFLVCKDPPVIAVQAPSLAAFLDQIFEIGRAGHKNALRFVQNEATERILKEEPWLIPVRTARHSSDPLLSDFARKLPSRFQVADLRGLEVGSGFGLKIFGADTVVRRHGDELLFAVGREGWERRLLKKLLEGGNAYADWVDRHRPRVWSKLWDKLVDLYPREFK